MQKTTDQDEGGVGEQFVTVGVRHPLISLPEVSNSDACRGQTRNTYERNVQGLCSLSFSLTCMALLFIVAGIQRTISL